ncbi:hypothetical protein Tcan_18804 [Toxocara canis]|uniref:Uncharacterized protein n=1 Tax=Toxocara canis TaxID=6265 RepID=A0A0B2W2L7_TOXCA|nr:hypothetical protein Tcan_18804 [Toxocara canis]
MDSTFTTISNSSIRVKKLLEAVGSLNLLREMTGHRNITEKVLERKKEVKASEEHYRSPRHTDE